MAAITINDLSGCRLLDAKAMSSLKGAGAPWVYGWIRPYVGEAPSFGSAINFFQITNNYSADQMNNQIQVVDVRNSAPNANINVVLAEDATNFRQF